MMLQLSADLHQLQRKGYSKLLVAKLNFDTQSVRGSCLTSTICLFPAPIKSLRLSLPGELRIALHAPSPGWPVL